MGTWRVPRHVEAEEEAQQCQHQPAQHFETRQQILPLKTSEYFADKAQEVSAKTTLELYDKVSTLDMGAPFRVEDGSIRVHARRRDRVQSQNLLNRFPVVEPHVCCPLGARNHVT